MSLWGCGSDIAKFFEVNLWNVYFNQEIKRWCLRGDCYKNLNNRSYGKSHWLSLTDLTEDIVKKCNYWSSPLSSFLK